MFLIDRQIFFFTIPSLELIQNIKPIRNVIAFAADHQHLSRTVPPIDSPLPLLPVDFCVVKRTGIMLYSLRESLSYIKVSKRFDPVSTNYLPTTSNQDIPLPGGAFFARRIGMSLCIADREQYILVNLSAATATPILPISQVPPEPGTRPHRPMILVVTEEEFLILSWTGAGTMGVFINLNGDPVRGTLQWEAHPLSISPSLLPLLPRHFFGV